MFGLDCGRSLPRARMGVRRPVPNLIHALEARRDQLADRSRPLTVRHTVLRPSLRFRCPQSQLVLCRRDRSLVDPTLGQQRPNGSGCLVGQGNDHNDGWLARKHSRQPRSCRSATPSSLLHRRACPDDQQAAQRTLAHFGGSSEFLFAASGSLQWRQPHPSRKIPPLPDRRDDEPEEPD
jgi:hypothetical protein